MAEMFLSPFVGNVMERVLEGLIYYLQDQFKWQTGMKKELERLQANHLKITAVVSAAKPAQTKDQNSALNKWIWRLRDAIDEADDFLDDLKCMKHQEQDCWQELIQVGERALKTDPFLNRLVEVVQKLDIISAEVSDFLDLLKNINQEQREQQVKLHITRETGSSPKDDLIGRGEDMESVIEWLRKPSDVTTTGIYRDISLLSIVAHGGMGKTTLLQHVYVDEITKEFDLKMWVCVSDNFDVKKVFTDMLECLQKKRPSLETLDALQETLQSEVKSKKFLLVLDDIWDDEEGVSSSDNWRILLSSLAHGGLGSKILITTRTDSAASMIAKVIRKQKEVKKLEGLKEKECLELLNTHAFDVGENPNDHKKLKSIAKELVKNLHGSPLAAKVIGGVLNSNLNESHWRCVLNNSSGQNDIISILKLSYIFLPKHLQSCFSYCSIFEQDHLFDKDDLIQLWIAVGFIQPSDSNPVEDLSVEDIGERYFGDLIKKSFFHEIFFVDGSSRGYKMHDLLHELAQSVSTHESLRFVGDEKSKLLEIPETLRHLSVETRNPEVLKTAGRFKNLRTLRITYECDSNLVDALIETFQVTRSIRSLTLCSQLEVIPEEIKFLRHLRYFRLSFSNIKLLPRSLSSLYHLQFITLYKGYDQSHCPNDYFPRDMNKLSNLRFLSSNYWLNFPGIGKLKFLQQLVGPDIKNEKGYKIDELEQMNELHILDISNLGNVRDAQEAFNAKLCGKRKLTDLFLRWNNEKYESEDRDLTERVLDNLQPHNYLKTLKIYHYMGARSAIWMNDAHLINNLEVIMLSNCLEWEILPPFGQLPFLKSLTLEKMPKVKRLENKFHGNDMHCVFPSLQTLSIEELEALVDWFDANVVDGLFPCLTKLKLSRCPNLQELPYLPSKLESLDLSYMEWKTLNCSSISKSIPLTSLKVLKCPNITSISPCVFPSLQSLQLINVEALVNLFDASVVDGFFPCLTTLDLSDCPNLQELPYLPPKLESLEIENIGWKSLNCCSISKSIPLQTLEVRHCPNITSISLTNISSLKNLMLNGLPQLRNDNIVEALEYMNDLRSLVLTNLDNVRDAVEACNAKLCDKRKLTHLSLEWHHAEPDIGDRDLDERVLDNLQPHNYLTTLWIKEYMGGRSAIWMNEAHLINNLEVIYLSNCLEWEILPPFGQLPFLKTLYLWNMPKLKGLENKFHGNDMCSVFPSLQKLCIIDMEALVDWFDASVVDGLFPCLTQLELINCPNSQELPYLPPKLESLEIEKIGWKTLNCCSISKSIPLETLLVRDCPNITSIFAEGEMGKLKIVKIQSLPLLQSFPSSLANIDDTTDDGKRLLMDA